MHNANYTTSLYGRCSVTKQQYQDTCCRGFLQGWYSNRKVEKNTKTEYVTGTIIKFEIKAENSKIKNSLISHHEGLIEFEISVIDNKNVFVFFPPDTMYPLILT